MSAVTMMRGAARFMVDLCAVVRHRENAGVKWLLPCFVCSQNKLRSPTAEEVFSSLPNFEVASAGLNKGAETPLTAELVEWADIIFVMEQAHRSKLTASFKPQLNRQRLICLDIPDRFQFMDPELVRILKQKVPKFLGLGKDAT
jgi:predicted protein tyrosine phosphatase